MRLQEKLWIGVTLAIAPARLAAQTVAGTVIDRDSRTPIAGVSIIVRSARDSSLLVGGISDSLGKFALRLPRPDTAYIMVRRIGLEPLIAPPKAILVERTRTLRFEMEHIPQLLDTMRTEAKKYLQGAFYKLTAGQEWFAQHLRAGKGFFTSGTEIELSGLLPCDYLGRLPGLEVATVLARDVRSVACYGEHSEPVGYLVTRNQATCLEVYVDRQHPLIGVDANSFGVAVLGMAKQKWVPLEGIRGIEVFMNYEDRPKDFSHVDAPAMLQGGARPQRCALILLWTAQYWGQ